MRRHDLLKLSRALPTPPPSQLSVTDARGVRSDAAPAERAPGESTLSSLLSAIGNATLLDALGGDALDGFGALINDTLTLSLAGVEREAGPALGSNEATLDVMRHAQAGEGVNDAALSKLRLGGGAPLPAPVLARVSRVFGHDLSHVRIHEGANAARMADAAQARAFTVGHEIWFNTGELDLSTHEGLELLLHELTHVVQADEGRLPHARGDGLNVSSPTDPHEQEAERTAAALMPTLEVTDLYGDGVGLLGDGLLNDDVWAAAVDTKPQGPHTSAEVVSRMDEDGGGATPRPSVQGVQVGRWTDSFEAPLVGGAELAPPTAGQVGFPSRGEAIAWAATKLVDIGADGAVIVRRGERTFAFAMSVESTFYDFTAQNISSGLTQDSLHADCVATPGIEGFVTQDGVFVAPHTFVELDEEGEMMGGLVVLAGERTSVPSEADYASLTSMARSDDALALGEEGAIALFKGLLKAKAVARLEENRAALDALEAYYAPDAPDREDRWDGLRPLVEADQALAEEEQQLMAVLAGRDVPVPFMFRLGIWALFSNPGMLNAEELATVTARLDFVKAARAQLRVEVPELSALNLNGSPTNHTDDELYAGMVARIADARAAIDSTRQKVLTEDMPLTSLGPIVQDTIAELGLTPERASGGHALSQHVLDWLDGERREEAIIHWVGAVLTITLLAGALLAPGGWLAILGLGAEAAVGLGVASAAVSLASASYHFERADDLNDAAEASGAGAPNALVDDPNAARLDYTIAWLNLVLAALDLAVIARSLHVAAKLPNALPVSPQKQAGHIKGSPQHLVRVKGGKPTSTFDNAADAAKYTQEAWRKGKVVPGRPNVREYDFGRRVGSGPKGGAQTIVRVHMDKSGKIHGHPKGPEGPP